VIVQNRDGISCSNSSFPTITYNDVWDSFLENFRNCPDFVGDILTTNPNGDPVDIYYNISLDPQFVDPDNGDYHLQPSSPCIDAGDPGSPLDPDGTVADIGALYYDQLDPPVMVDAPGMLVVEDYPDDHGRLLLAKFDASVDRDNLTGYSLYYETEEGWNFSSLTAVPSHIDSVAITVLAPDNIPRQWAVAAQRDTELSEKTVSFNKARPIDNIPPTPPNNLQAVPSTNLDGIALTWVQSADDKIVRTYTFGNEVIAIPGVEIYRVLRRTEDTAFTEIASLPAGTTGYIDYSAQYGVPYTYQTIAADLDNASSDNPSASAAIQKIGDPSGNAEISPFDASLILRHTVGLIALPDVSWPNFCPYTADVSRDGTIAALDASLILQYVVGLLSVFPVEDGQQAKVAYHPRIVRTGSPETLPGNRIRLPILIDEMDDVVAGELTLSFSGDPGDVTVHTTALTSDYLLAQNVQDNRIRAAFAGAESRTGAGTILEVMFDASDADVLNSLQLERVVLNEGGIPVCISQDAETPKAYRLHPNYPNPFNAETTIAYDVAEPRQVRLAVYTLTGQLVRTLVDGEQPAGSYSVTWDGRDGTGRDVASGVYVCRLEARGHRTTRKMLLVR